MDNQVANDLAELEVVSISSMGRTTMLAFVSVYRRRPAFVEIYLRGRTNLAVHQFGRNHNLRVAQDLRRSRSTPGSAAHRRPAKLFSTKWLTTSAQACQHLRIQPIS